ncbi:heterokaryon incompatibility protein-domain-containing protein [Echria macrotheca]|uniref:Heterokaryon incompatibility protein-domain-containing protein n=1 Tax=Echria macrotheca TaxID=438768 RepID=A0AAJ0FBT5_9PEZI|nr:heterokaryon incompatibility protein-domain-containing protein [Echria macrotheca]
MSNSAPRAVGIVIGRCIGASLSGVLKVGLASLISFPFSSWPTLSIATFWASFIGLSLRFDPAFTVGFPRIWTYLTRDGPSQPEGQSPILEAADVTESWALASINIVSSVCVANTGRILRFLFRNWFRLLIATASLTVVAPVAALLWLHLGSASPRERIRGAPLPVLTLFFLARMAFRAIRGMSHLFHSLGWLTERCLASATANQPRQVSQRSKPARPEMYRYPHSLVADATWDGTDSQSAPSTPAPPLIRLLAVTKKFPFSTTCQLLVVPLPVAARMGYEAISYTWGGQKPGEIYMECDGKWLATTPNVHAIVRDRASYRKTRFLWIDAVCINQGDKDEKAYQIGLMSDIYARSTRVVVWLNSGDFTSADVRSALEALEYTRFAVANWELYERQWEERRMANVASDDKWAALIRLLGHQYWYRMWILQEIAKGTVVHMVVGGWWLSWEYFSVMMELVEEDPGANIMRQEAFYQGLPHGVLTRGSSQVTRIRKLRSGVHGDSRKGYTLAECLTFSSDSQATDPKDKIYALGNLLGPNAHTLKVNYSDVYTASLLFTDTAAALVEEAPFMTLFLAGRDTNREGDVRTGENCLPLPSWVPNFAQCTAADYDLLDLSAKHYRALRSHLGNPDCSPITVTASTALHMLVTPLSTIGRISPQVLVLPSPYPDPASQANLSLIYAIQSIPAVYHAAARTLGPTTGFYPYTPRQTNLPPYHTHPTPSHALRQTWYEALWRTLLADMAPNRQEYNLATTTPTGTVDVTTTDITSPAPPEYDTYFQVALDQFSNLVTADGIAAAARTSPLSPRLQQLIMALPTAKRHLTYIGMNISTAVRMANTKRRFAISEKMHTMLVPESAKEGDLVGVVRGVAMPIVLRRDGDESEERWRFVGCCYVHGLMTGDDLCSEGGAPAVEKTFVVV